MSDDGPFSEGSAAAAGLARCHSCAHVRPVVEKACKICGEPLHLRRADSISRTVALTIASIILYIPANLLPIMEVRGVGGTTSDTILSGVVTFWEMKAYPVAVIIFTASVAIPLLKLCAIFLLCRAASRPHDDPVRMMKIYRATEIVGRWSMVDVFVVAILVAMVQMGNLMSIQPGPAALSFGAVVVLTMLAAGSFDPRLIWDKRFPVGSGKIRDSA